MAGPFGMTSKAFCDVRTSEPVVIVIEWPPVFAVAGILMRAETVRGELTVAYTTPTSEPKSTFVTPSTKCELVAVMSTLLLTPVWFLGPRVATDQGALAVFTGEEGTTVSAPEPALTLKILKVLS